MAKSKICAVIRPMTVGRGHAPAILADILRDEDITLTSFRVWQPCATTMRALGKSLGDDNATIELEDTWIYVQHNLRPSTWILAFESDMSNDDLHARLTSIYRTRIFPRFSSQSGPVTYKSIDTPMRIFPPESTDIVFAMLF